MNGSLRKPTHSHTSIQKPTPPPLRHSQRIQLAGDSWESVETELELLEPLNVKNDSAPVQQIATVAPLPCAYATLYVKASEIKNASAHRLNDGKREQIATVSRQVEITGNDVFPTRHSQNHAPAWTWESAATKEDASRTRTAMNDSTSIQQIATLSPFARNDGWRGQIATSRISAGLAMTIKEGVRPFEKLIVSV